MLDKAPNGMRKRDQLKFTKPVSYGGIHGN
jgi:hypothetical protein